MRIAINNLTALIYSCDQSCIFSIQSSVSHDPSGIIFRLCPGRHTSRARVSRVGTSFSLFHSGSTPSLAQSSSWVF